MTDIIDRFRKLLLRQEVVIANLSETDLGIILVSAALSIPEQKQLTERDVTDCLIEWSANVGSNVNADAVEIRRYLVDFRCLQRDVAGRAYNRPAQWPARLQPIAAELESFDNFGFADQVRVEEVERRAARKKEALEKQLGTSKHH